MSREPAFRYIFFANAFQPTQKKDAASIRAILKIQYRHSKDYRTNPYFPHIKIQDTSGFLQWLKILSDGLQFSENSSNNLYYLQYR